MSTIHEIATLTSKGQITVPKSIRQYLGVDAGARIAFSLEKGQVTVVRVDDDQHEDPAIGYFLTLLEKDIQNGRHISSLSEDLAQSLLARLGRQVDLDEDIEGDVAL